jgi:hypothetical protein
MTDVISTKGSGVLVEVTVQDEAFVAKYHPDRTNLSRGDA